MRRSPAVGKAFECSRYVTRCEHQHPCQEILTTYAIELEARASAAAANAIKHYQDYLKASAALGIAEAEHDDLLKAVADHVTKRGQYKVERDQARAERDALREKLDDVGCEFCDEGAECCKPFDNSYGEMLKPLITVCTKCWNDARKNLAALRAEIVREHELYLTAHRDNMKAAARIMELKVEVDALTKERDEALEMKARWNNTADNAIREMEAYRAEVEAMRKVVEAARYIGTEHSGYCATVACNCVGHAKRRVDLAAALASLPAAPETK